MLVDDIATWGIPPDTLELRAATEKEPVALTPVAGPNCEAVLNPGTYVVEASQHFAVEHVHFTTGAAGKVTLIDGRFFKVTATGTYRFGCTGALQVFRLTAHSPAPRAKKG